MGPFIQKFRKYNFCNDHVITKITKIFYYKNLELYGVTESKLGSPIKLENSN